MTLNRRHNNIPSRWDPSYPVVLTDLLGPGEWMKTNI